MHYIFNDTVVLKLQFTKNLMKLCPIFGREFSIEYLLPYIKTQIKDDSEYMDIEFRSIILEELDMLIEVMGIGFGGWKFGCSQFSFLISNWNPRVLKFKLS